MLKQNAEILLEVAENYEIILEKKKNAPKQEAEKYEEKIKNFKNQFLYLLTAMHKIIEQEKNVR
ncbi:hypothetical protein HYU23_02595 [Candidatus Woesearchaeota archaeon]|nr:hypothetical protein [Candidatus Woesearchaeota archaeon]